MSCEYNKSTTKSYTGQPAPEFNTDCIPTGDGAPTAPPQEDQPPFYVDSECQITYIWLCNISSWVPFERTIADLEETDISALARPCTDVRVPVSYDIGTCSVEGTISLGELSEVVEQCSAPQCPDTFLETTESRVVPTPDGDRVVIAGTIPVGWVLHAVTTNGSDDGASLEMALDAATGEFTAVGEYDVNYTTVRLTGIDPETCCVMAATRNPSIDCSDTVAPTILEASNDGNNLFIRAAVDTKLPIIEVFQYNGSRGAQLTVNNDGSGIITAVGTYDPAYPSVLVLTRSSICSHESSASADGCGDARINVASATVNNNYNLIEMVRITGSRNPDYFVEAYHYNPTTGIRGNRIVVDRGDPCSTTNGAFSVDTIRRRQMPYIVIVAKHAHLDCESEMIVSTFTVNCAPAKTTFTPEYVNGVSYNSATELVHYSATIRYNYPHIELYYYNDSTSTRGARIPLIETPSSSTISQYNADARFPYDPAYPEVLTVINSDMYTCEDTTISTINGAP